MKITIENRTVDFHGWDQLIEWIDIHDPQRMLMELRSFQRSFTSTEVFGLQHDLEMVLMDLEDEELREQVEQFHRLTIELEDADLCVLTY